MTLEDEKRLALLAAILVIGGRGSKGRVLDELERRKLLNLTDDDRKTMRSRNEEHWRNDLAFIRKHLVEARYVSDEQYDSWAITATGRKYAGNLAPRALTQRQGTYVRTHEAAELIHSELAPQVDDAAAESTETVASEGASRRVWTTKYERDSALRSEAIRIHGLKCMGCKFSFAEAYGEIGQGYIEVHHLNPIGLSDGPVSVSAQTDLIVLCSNCHSIVHRRKGKPLSLSELRTTLIGRGGK